MMPVLGEIKRRKVFQVAVVYAVVAWLIIQIIGEVSEPLNLPGWLDTVVIVLLAVGFPIALVLSWAYDVTPRGIVRTKELETPNDKSLAVLVDDYSGIVVLPFENLSPDPDNAYFADGLAEELISDLSNIESLRVISRTSAMSFKGTKKDVTTIAQELQVQYVLEGSVRREDNALRITAQLIDAVADSHLWAEKYSGTVDDIFDLQEQLSRQIVDCLKLKLSADEEKQLADRPIPDIRAYDHYLRARVNIYSFDQSLIERAIRDLKAALAILGDNVLLLKALGLAYFQKINVGASEVPSVIDDIEACAHRIAELDPSDAGSYLLRGLTHVPGGADWRSAAVLFREAYGRDSSDRDTLLFLGVTSLSTGQMDDAGRVLRELHRVDPVDPLSVLLIGYHHFFEGRFEDAAGIQERSLILGPEVIISRWAAVRTFIAAGKQGSAEDSAGFLRNHDPSSPIAEAATLLLGGLREKMEDVPEPGAALGTWAKDAEFAQYLSDAYAFRGDGEKALEWLEVALRSGFMNHAYLSQHDPFIASFRDSPSWRDVLRKVKEQQQEFESKLTPLSGVS
jgi:TolB-like protein